MRPGGNNNVITPLINLVHLEGMILSLFWVIPIAADVKHGLSDQCHCQIQKGHVDTRQNGM